MSTRGRKRSVSYEEVIEYKLLHPAAFQWEIGDYFGLTQSQIGKILRSGGVTGTHLGRPPARQQGMSDEQYKWELILHNERLGMDRGCKLNDQRIHYGFDPLRQEQDQESATSDQ